MDDLGHPGGGIVDVTDEDRLDRADHHARRLEPDVEPVRAEVALLRGVILGVDEDGVIWACRHARLATDACRLVEVDDAVVALVHRGGRARGHAGRIVALIAPGHLEVAPGLRKEPTSTLLT